MFGDTIGTVCLSSPNYYVNVTSNPAMLDVLVITLPPRNYTNLTFHDTVS